MTTPPPIRSGADRCPGLLTPFVSADGAMVRLRLPGGRVDPSTLVEITCLARRFGDPQVTLTSRGSLQLRGLPDPLPRELITAIGDLGLIPSGPHDKARNIVADPDPALDDLVEDVDSQLLADPLMAWLPGRFLLAVAGPDGPVLGEPWDVAIVDEGRSARVVVDGRCVEVARDLAAGIALDVARRFLAERTDTKTWNVRDLPDEVRTALLPGSAPFDVRATEPPAPGPAGEDLVVLVPLGLLTGEMAQALGGWPFAASSSHDLMPLRITPWRSIVVPGGADRADELIAAGVVTAPDSPWTALTACAGAPSCARTDTPTRDLAREAAPLIDPAGPPVHVIGCDRACGHPAREHTISLNPHSAADVVAAQRPSRDEKD